jgi:hypothetical protein
MKKIDTGRCAVDPLHGGTGGADTCASMPQPPVLDDSLGEKLTIESLLPTAALLRNLVDSGHITAFDLLDRCIRTMAESELRRREIVKLTDALECIVGLADVFSTKQTAIALKALGREA